MLRKISLPIQLLLVIGAAFLFGHYLTEYQVRIFYTFSLFFKEILGFCLPFIIFSFILSGILSFKKGAHIVLAVLFICIVVSNFLISMTSFSIGKFLLEWLHEGCVSKGLSSQIQLAPIYKISLPVLIGSEKAMLLAVGLGMLGSFVNLPRLEQRIFLFKNFVESVLNKIFIPLLPIYVLGFLLKLFHEGSLVSLLGTYGKAFGLVIALQWSYLFVMYLIANGWKICETVGSIKNSMPSYLAAFSTMSSTAAIPVTVNCMKKNFGNKSFAQVAAPILANIHLVGDSITVPIFALVTLSLFLGLIPSISTFLVFVFYFCLAMLAVSGVPGGGIIVMIPILKSILGFTPDMISVITALYLLQDAIGTAGNVMGDGALAIIVHKILRKLKVF